MSVCDGFTSTFSLIVITTFLMMTIPSNSQFGNVRYLRSMKKQSSNLQLLNAVKETEESQQIQDINQNDAIIKQGDQIKQGITMKEWLESHHMQPLQYLQIQSIQHISQLPICAITFSQSSLTALKETRYHNLKIIVPTNMPHQNSPNIYAGDISNIIALRETVNKYCNSNDLLIFLKDTIWTNFLAQLNEIHQKKNAWLSFTRSQNKVAISSVYKRVFDLFFTNRFFENGGRIERQNQGSLTTGLFQLSQLHKFQISKSMTQYGYLWTSLDYKFVNKYQSLIKLNQQYEDNTTLRQQLYKRMISYNFKRQKIKKITLQDVLKALQYQQLLYLPKQHILAKRQQNQLNAKFKMFQYPLELPLCLTVPSRNNFAQKRYRRMIQSILQQNYTNYHIVYIDDNSDDGTMEAVKQLLIQLQFPLEKVTLIQNLERKNATYNILHSAFHHCSDNSIQIVLDGDDQIIGRQTLRLISSMYQKHHSWILYTNFHTSLYTVGTSKPLMKQQGLLVNNTRVRGHYFGVIRTWKTKLIRKIPIQHHQFENGSWLDTLYDDALQHPLFEMAGLKYTTYIPQICYLYNKDTGANDHATKESQKHRTDTYLNLVLLRTPLSRINSLEEGEEQKQIAQVFIRQRQTYHVIKY